MFEPPDAVAVPRGLTTELDNAGIAVTRGWEASPVTLDGGVTFRRLSPNPTRGLDFFESIYPPGATATLGDIDLFKHEGYEIGNVVAGEPPSSWPTTRWCWRPATPSADPCSVPHRIRNAGVRPAVATWLIVHP